MKMANAPSWSPLLYASNAGPARWKKASPLGSDRRAAGVAGDMGARHSEMVEDRRGVGGVASDADR
jgi:hypothetical protein